MRLEFRHELEALINKHSMESVSDTPDFILCQYLMGCLAAFELAVIAREQWHGRRDDAAVEGGEEQHVGKRTTS